ncbi:MAG: DNA-directed RNA polymerase subunit omega [Holosporales bacterium]|jgi:DNA-directed RNA polymerase subunit omega|nr:DNA-directed RNA polymerase subunit omega [Holosporales bacterium]
MARITVEDCAKNIKNRFNLVVMASQRAQQILSGDKITVRSDNDKVPVIALREIAASSVSLDDIYNYATKRYRKYNPVEESLESLGEDPIEEVYASHTGLEESSMLAEDDSNQADTSDAAKTGN